MSGIPTSEAMPNEPMMRPTSAREAPSASRCTGNEKKLVTDTKNTKLATVAMTKLEVTMPARGSARRVIMGKAPSWR